MTDHTPVLLSGYSVVNFFIEFRNLRCYSYDVHWERFIGKSWPLCS